MFTGIVQAQGAIRSMVKTGGDCRLEADIGGLAIGDIAIGDSVAVNGVCLTAVQFGENSFFADVSVETLSLTTLGDLGVHDPVNLELALTPSSRLGGHLVSGHVDGIGELIERWPDARSERYTFQVPQHLCRYIAAKGSICIEGISLTVNSVEANRFSVNIVPHTQQVTTLGACHPGARVNIEIDVIARYLERLMTGGEAHADSAISEQLLKQTGFIDTGD